MNKKIGHLQIQSSEGSIRSKKFRISMSKTEDIKYRYSNTGKEKNIE